MKQYRLGDVISIKHGYAFSGDFIQEDDNGIVLVTPGNFRIGGGFQEEKCKFFSGEIPEEYVLNARDFIVTMTDLSKTIDTLGYSAYVPFSKRVYLHNQRIGLVSLISDECDRDYLYWLMRSHYYQRSIANTSTGSTVHHTSPSKICEFSFFAPEKCVQSKIASILSAYDNLIENNQKQIKLLEEAAQRLYKEWFIDLRFPGHEDTPIVDGVPEGWEKAPVDSRIALLSGYAFKSAQFDNSGRYKIVTIKNVKDGEFDGINTSRMVSIPDKMPRHCILTDGDILLSLTGNVGRTCIVNGNDYLLNQRVAKLQSDIPAFTYCLFRSSDMFDAMNTLANGAAQQNLSPVRTGKIMVLFPSGSLLDKFERIAGSMICKMLSLRKQCDLLIQARNCLLPKLMSGEIEV